MVDAQSRVRDGSPRIGDAQPYRAAAGLAPDGGQPAPRVSELRPDVVLMDVRMPVLDGIEAPRRLVEGGRAEGTGILGLTTHGTGSYACRMRGAGSVGLRIKQRTAVPRGARVSSG
ncbi:response regulator, partial [Clavibacter michiganensis]|uniref:response regulator n=1 Tax=Clavibacter michiganensis TaxID=28447 RepID=UPI00292E27AC